MKAHKYVGQLNKGQGREREKINTKCDEAGEHNVNKSGMTD